jgi:hypothetical protein
MVLGCDFQIDMLLRGDECILTSVIDILNPFQANFNKVWEAHLGDIC